MAFDESLAQRICDALARRKNIEEKKMFNYRSGTSSHHTRAVRLGYIACCKPI